MTIALKIEDQGLIDYQQAWELQRELQSALIGGSNREALVFCEHHPVLTYGGSSELARVLLAKPEELQQKSISLFKTDRGGNITFHGPGQLICYLIIDLKKRRQDVAWYLRTLEQAIVELLSQYHIKAFCLPSKTGVWVSETTKICSIGIRISRWCCMHGISLNLSKGSEQGFEQIIPCGIEGAKVTSIESLIGRSPSQSEVIERLSDILLKLLYENFGLPYQLEK